MTDAVLETRDLRKNYRRIEALRGVSLTVRQGEIYGFLGQNGAGKTTLVKILLGITRGWHGEARLLGQPAGTAHVRKRVGYLPEDHRFPDYHTGYSLLDFYGELLGVPRLTRHGRIPDMLDTVGLRERMHTKIRGYSKGMKQRLGIAQALMHEPDLVFLDEPTDGVDPLGRRHIRELLQHLKARGCTIFLNSHLLGEVELICDRVAILERGELVREGSIAELTRTQGVFVVGLAPGQTMPAAELEAQGFHTIPQGIFWEIQLTDGQSIDPVVDLLRARGLSVRHLVEKRQSLEELFLKTVGGDERERRRPPRDDGRNVREAVIRRPPRERTQE